MVETVFVALFVVLPLAGALLFLLYRSRLFLRNMLVIAFLAVGVWGVLQLASADFSLFDRPAVEPSLYHPISCFSLTRDEHTQPAQGCML